MVHNWRRLLQRAFPTMVQGARRPAVCRLRLEQLEDRTMPAWIGATSGAANDAAHDYHNLANWENGVIDDSFAGVTLSGDLTLYLSANRVTGPTGLNLDYDGNFSLTLTSSTTAVRSLTLGGDVGGDFGGADDQTVTLSSLIQVVLPATVTFDVPDAGDNLVVNGVITVFTAGLLQGRLTGSAFNETAPNPGDQGIVLSPVMGEINTKPPWGDNETWVYTGQIFDADGRFSLAENIDDNVLIKIDGVQRLRDTVWNVPTTTGILNLTPGWHDIEIRFGNGGGGAGPVAANGWNAGKGFGYNASGTTSTDGANYVNLLDPGNATLLRTNTGSGGVTKTGAGTLTLAGANAYSGATTISAGTLVAQHDTALGTTTGGTTVAAGATLHLAGGITIGAEPLTLNGGATDNLVSLGGDNRYNGSITINAAAAGIRTTAGTLTLAGFIQLNSSATLTVSGDGDTMITGTISDFAPGLRGDYFQATGATTLLDNTDPNWLGLKTPTVANVVTNSIDFTTIDTNSFAPYASIGGDNVAARWTGKINITSPGLTTFFTTSDDGSVIYIDGILVVNNNFLQGPTERSGAINLSAGLHDIDIEFFEAAGGAFMQAHYTPAGGSKQILDSTVLLTTGGAGSLVKNGNGALVIEGAGLYAGPTTVNAGTLIVNGSIRSATTVKNGAALAGSGRIQASVTAESGSLVSPGAGGPDDLTITGNLQLAGGSTFHVQLDGFDPDQFDQLIVGQAGQPSGITLGGTLTGTFAGAWTGQKVTIIENLGDGPIVGTFAGAAEGATVLVGGQEFIISYQDGEGGNDVTLLHVFRPPVQVNNEVLTVAEGGSGTITTELLQFIDQQQGPADLTYTVITSPFFGQLLLSGVPTTTFTQADIDAGLVTYAHAGGENTEDNFTFRVTDGAAGGNHTVGPFRFDMVITPVNDAPTIAQGASVNVTMSEDGSPIAFSLTLNASDPDGGPLIWSISTAAGNGTAGVLPPGPGGAVAVTYAPDTHFAGSDSFVVQVSDGNTGIDTITVNVTVIPVNDAPVVQSGSFATTFLIPITIDLWGLVSDVETLDPALSFLVGNAANGSVVLLADGHTAQFTGAAVGPGSFDYFVTDTGHGSSPPETRGEVVFIDVRPQTPVPPDAVDNSYATDEDSPTAGNLITDDTGLGVDSDPNIGNIIRIVAVNGVAAAVDVPIVLPSGASLMVLSDGSFTYDPSTSGKLNKLAQGEMGADSFTYTLGDGTGLTDDATVHIILTGINDTPTGPLTKKFAGIRNNKTKMSLSKLLSGCHDPDNDPLQVVVLTPPKKGKLLVTGNGGLVYKPPRKFTGKVTFTYRVEDPNGAFSDPVTVTIKISRGRQGRR